MTYERLFLVTVEVSPLSRRKVREQTMKSEREDFIVIKEIQKKVEEKLTETGVKVYFIAFEMDDDKPYFAYTFDESIVAEAKEDWEQGMMPMNCFDDYSFEDDFERIVNDICNIITQRSKTDE